MLTKVNPMKQVSVFEKKIKTNNCINGFIKNLENFNLNELKSMISIKNPEIIKKLNQNLIETKIRVEEKEKDIENSHIKIGDYKENLKKTLNKNKLIYNYLISAHNQEWRKKNRINKEIVDLKESLNEKNQKGKLIEIYRYHIHSLKSNDLLKELQATQAIIPIESDGFFSNLAFSLLGYYTVDPVEGGGRYKSLHDSICKTIAQTKVRAHEENIERIQNEKKEYISSKINNLHQVLSLINTEDINENEYTETINRQIHLLNEVKESLKFKNITKENLQLIVRNSNKKTFPIIRKIIKRMDSESAVLQKSQELIQKYNKENTNEGFYSGMEFITKQKEKIDYLRYQMYQIINCLD